jgi:hypothetical protein
MSPTNREIAEAFSSHRFELAIPHLAPDVHWNLVGADPIDGRAEVTEVCRETATELTDTTTTFDRFAVIDADDHVVVDALARYRDRDGSETAVASCDIYQFQDQRVVAITSYTVEL